MEDRPYWQRDDLVARLRLEASVNQGSARLCGDAADEIERLRLTDAEREAMARGAELADHAGEHSTTAAALRGLLKRLK